MIKRVPLRGLVSKSIIALLLSIMAFTIQIKVQKHFVHSTFTFLYPIIFLISWIDFTAAIASIIFITTAIIINIGNLSYSPDITFRLIIFTLSTSAIAWIIRYTKLREQVFAEKMHETSHQLYTIIENMQDAFFVVDKDWTIIFVNRNHEKISLIKRSEQIGKKLWEAFPVGTQTNSKYKSELEQVLRTGSSSSFEEFYAPLNLWTEVRANRTDEGGIAVFYRDITARKRQEEAILKSKNEFRALADSMPQIVFVADQKGIITYLNNKWNEYIGVRGMELATFKLKDFIHPEDFPFAITQWKESLQKGTSLSVECRLKNKEDEYRWHLIRALPSINKYGDVDNWFGTSTDIHDLRMIREALKHNEEKFEAIANNIPQMLWMSDGEGWVTWLNQRWTDYTGYAEVDLQGWRWEKVHHPDHLNRVQEGFKNHLLSGEPWEEIHPIRGKDGSYRWFLSRATPIHDLDGKIVRWFGSNTDINEQVKIEAMLNESQLHFRQLANAIPHIIWSSKPNGAMDFYNERFYEYTGINDREEVLQSWESIIHPDDYPLMVKKWAHSLTTGEPYQVEYRLKDKEGRYRWFLGLALPARDSQNNIIKWFGSGTDIEDSKQLSAQIENQKFELENALVTRDEFLSIASHELKTPLTSLKLHCQLYRKSMARGIPEIYSPQKITGLCNQIDKQVGKLNRLVDDMLDISRIRTGKLTLKPSEFELKDLIGEVMHTLSDQFTSNGCPLPAFIYPNEEVKVNWDRVRIEQVLMNLMTNTIRYGNGKPVLLTLKRENSKVFMAVKDNGIGIAPENFEKIFYRFEKIKNPKEVAGLGLGLFITKQIIEAHGGDIWVESQLGTGSEFKIELPC